MDNVYKVEITYEDGVVDVETFENKEEIFDRFRDTELDFEGFTDELFYNGEIEYHEKYRLLTGLPYKEKQYLVQYFEDFGRSGSLEGLFICSEDELEYLNGATVDFGEVLGKHSEVYSDETYENCKIITSNQDAIRDMEVMFGTKNISGYNPINFLGEDDE